MNIYGFPWLCEGHAMPIYAYGTNLPLQPAPVLQLNKSNLLEPVSWKESIAYFVTLIVGGASLEHDKHLL